MNYRKVTAICRIDKLETIEEKLRGLGVKGVSISKVKGYGEYVNFYTPDGMTDHWRIELFTEESQAEIIAQAIMEAACLEMEGDGIVAILPVEKLYRIRTKAVFKEE